MHPLHFATQKLCKPGSEVELSSCALRACPGQNLRTEGGPLLDAALPAGAPPKGGVGRRRSHAGPGAAAATQILYWITHIPGRETQVCNHNQWGSGPAGHQEGILHAVRCLLWLRSTLMPVIGHAAGLELSLHACIAAASYITSLVWDGHPSREAEVQATPAPQG